MKKYFTLLALVLVTLVSCEKEEPALQGPYIPSSDNIMSHFDALTKIPRRSNKEEKVRKYISGIADRLNYKHVTDAVGNLIVYIPASKGFESRPTVILQSHMDMVCAVDEMHQDFNFDTNPIPYSIREGWVQAEGTTLGADDGIGVAMMISVMETKEVMHGKLELLFTVDEEYTMIGADKLDASLLTGRTCINIDSEEFDKLYIGSAGSFILLDSELPFTQIPVPAENTFYEINILGLEGGHSGLEIGNGYTSAITVGGQFLSLARSKYDIVLEFIDGGEVDNSIPRFVTIRVGVPTAKASEFVTEFNNFSNSTFQQIKAKDPNAKFKIRTIDAPSSVIDKKATDNLLGFIAELPSGVIKMSDKIDGLVETSNNLGFIHTTNNRFVVSSHLRSSVAESLKTNKENIVNLCSKFHIEIKNTTSFPQWDANIASPIKQSLKQSFKQQLNMEVKEVSVHAGLECSYLVNHYPGIDIISIGPLILGAHTPTERLRLDTVEKLWKVLIDTLYHFKS